jgi:DNA polymerase-1
MNIKTFEKVGYEADDLIGTIVSQSTEIPNKLKINEVVIVTGDRDILQLVNDKKNIKLYMPIRGLSEARIFAEKETKERMGVNASQVVDYKALVGDPSDNYPGVSGIGPKTAEKLLLKYKTKEAIYRHLNEVDEKTRKVLENGKKGADISYKLAKIDTKVPIKVDFKAMSRWSVYNQKVEEVFTELGFKSLKERVKKISTKRISQDQGSLF